MVAKQQDRSSLPATRTVSATEARVHLGQMLRAVNQAGEDVIIERSGKPEGVIISMKDYQEFRRLRPKATTSDWSARFLALRAEILAEMGDKELGDVDEMIEFGQR